MSERFSKFEDPPIQNSGKGIKKDKDPLNRWEGWDSAPRWLREFSEKFNNAPTDGKAFMEQVIRELYMTPSEQRKYMRPDVIPRSYRENYQLLKNSNIRLNANPTGLTIEQILGTDRHFHRTYVNNNIFAQICQRYGCTRYASGKQWEIKHHKLEHYNWPVFTHTFRKLSVIDVAPEGVKSTGYGWGSSYEIPFTTIDQAAGGTYDPDYWALYFLSEKMGIFGDERGWLGGAGRNTTNAGAPNLKGLMNHANVVNLTSPSTDGGFSGGLADFNDNFADILTSWKGNSVYGDAANVYVSTPGIIAETTLHDSTAGDLKTLAQQMHHKWFLSGDFDAWYCSENLVSTALASMTNSTQEFFAARFSPKYIRRTVVYPLQRKIMLDKQYSDDVKFAYITGDVHQVYDGNCLITSHSTSACKTQQKGWRMNGLFLDNTRSTGQKQFQAPIRA
jgi:hypothetical protein